MLYHNDIEFKLNLRKFDENVSIEVSYS